MVTKIVVVHLDTGVTKRHELNFEGNAGYAKWINICADALTGNPRGILGFTTPLCIYKVQNIIAIEFSDPPPQTEKLPIGYRRPSESDSLPKVS